MNLPNNEEDLANTILSISQLSPMPDISKYFESSSSISPLKTPSNFFNFSDYATDFSNYHTELDDIRDLKFEVDDEGVTNELFERINLDRSDESELNDYVPPILLDQKDITFDINIEKLSPINRSGSASSLTFESIPGQAITPFSAGNSPGTSEDYQLINHSYDDPELIIDDKKPHEDFLVRDHHKND